MSAPPPPKRLRWLALASFGASVAVLGSGLRLLNVALDTNYYPQAVDPHDAIIWRTIFWGSVLGAAASVGLLVRRIWA